MKSLVVAAVVLLQAASPAVACRDQDLNNPSESVQVLLPVLSTSKTEGPVVITVMGTLKNSTAAKVDDLVVEAKFFDAQKKVVDVLTQPLFGIIVPPGQEVAFRMQGQAAASQSSYASVEARVTSGQTHSPATTKPQGREQNKLLEFLISWGPMLLLILVWVVLARKYSGKGSAHQRSVELIAEQNALLGKQLAAIESIAAVASKSSKAGEV